jgi:hypothetical protein
MTTTPRITRSVCSRLRYEVTTCAFALMRPLVSSCGLVHGYVRRGRTTSFNGTSRPRASGDLVSSATCTPRLSTYEWGSRQYSAGSRYLAQCHSLEISAGKRTRPQNELKLKPLATISSNKWTQWIEMIEFDFTACLNFQMFVVNNVMKQIKHHKGRVKEAPWSQVSQSSSIVRILSYTVPVYRNRLLSCQLPYFHLCSIILFILFLIFKMWRVV